MEQTERQLPLRRAETAAVFIIIVQAVAGGVALLLSRLGGSAAAEAAAWHLFAGVVMWAGCLVHQRLRRLATEESLTAESLAHGRKGEAGPRLFEAEGADLLTARNRLAQFERYFLPAFSVLIILILGGVCFYLLRYVAPELRGAPAEPLRNFWGFAGIAFVTFLLARYSAGLATQVPWRPLRAGADYMMSCALGSLLVAVAFVFCFFELPIAERIVAWVVPVALAVVAVEMLLLLVMGAYRPRVAGEEVRPAHDSRLLGMLTTSRGILRTTAETLDYQFGFKVSETWFYRFMGRAIGPLLLFQALTLEVLTCFVIVDTGEQAVVECFGRPRSDPEPLGPGLHLKWPWPIEAAYRYPTGRVEQLVIGEQLQLKEGSEGFLWTESHARQPFNLLAANRQAAAPPGKEGEAPAPKPAEDRAKTPSVSLITGTVNVFYHVDNLHDFLYNTENPKRTLEALCYRELTRYTASCDFMEFLTYKRGEAVTELKKAIQAAATRAGLGVAIVDVMLQGLHPPVEVAASFEEVVGALQQKEAKVSSARGQASARVARAEGDAAGKIAKAEIDAAQRRHVTPAAAAAFRMQLEAHRKAPSVYKHRKLLAVIEETLAGARKIIKPHWLGDVRETIHLNLEEKTAPGMSPDITGSEGTRP
ncbi:MAG: protease modulator HflK [Planctomycetes bacterium]|nr:protease modulator HflK [Planctomycetota bacterium]